LPGNLYLFHMTRRRWIADEHSADTAALTGAHAAHLARVLRARVGQHFDIVAGDVVRHGTISSVSPDRVEFSLAEVVDVEASSDISMVLAIFKFDRFEWAIEKCTELGVAKIFPVVARRTDAHLAQAAQKRVERWRRIALEASQQSRRTSPPEIADPMKLKEVVTLAFTTKVLLAENEKKFLLRDLFGEEIELPLVLAVGPEGGWSDEEVQLFESNGWRSASLGDTILRAETAAIASLAAAKTMLF
jgi:16S rRNA (uracil1498-N3)-methyltransferase